MHINGKNKRNYKTQLNGFQLILKAFNKLKLKNKNN